MAPDFDHILTTVLEHEGGYVLTETPGDRGGMTYAGISRRANPDWPGWDRVDAGDTTSEELKLEVRDRYEEGYWWPIKGDRCASHEVAKSMFSCAVLAGTKNAVRLAQLATGISADGKIGVQTLEAVHGIQPGTPDEGLFEARYALARIARYCEIAKRNPAQLKFLRGWISRAMADAR